MRHFIETVVDDTLLALKAKGELQLATRPAYSVDLPKNAAHGDLSCNVAMVLAKAEGKPPRKIAELILAHIVDTKRAVAKAEVAGPGFLNFFLTDAIITNVARDVLKAGDGYGRSARRTGKKIMVEFVSANPTGPVHIGHARGTFVGDAVSRLLDAAGHDVTREFYINDFGAQVKNLGRAVQARYLELYDASRPFTGEYGGAYVKDIARALQSRDGDKWATVAPESWLDEATAFGIAHNLASIRATLEGAGVEHSVWFSEQTLHDSGKVMAVVEDYRSRGVTYEADVARGAEDKVRREDSKSAAFEERQKGGTFLTTSSQGDDEDRVILRRDGTPVYLTADLAYHKEKFARGYDRMVTVLGADHAGHVPRLRAGMRLLGLDDQRLEFLLVQIVRLTRGGEEVKVSKRRGTVYELTDLIDEVGADAARVIFLSRSPTAQFEFDLDVLAKAGADNPVFSVQYGHARCASLLKRAAEKGATFVGEAALTDAHLARLALPEERALLKKLAGFADVVAGAGDALEPHRVFFYIHDLIGEFHGYYSKYSKTERIVSDDVEKTQGRLALVAALKQTLKSALGLLGVSAPEHMEAPVDVE